MDEMKRWIVVIDAVGEGKDRYMMVLKSEEQVIVHVSCLEEHQTLDRVFTVNQYGEVEYKEVVFKGRLKLIDKDKFI